MNEKSGAYYYELAVCMANELNTYDREKRQAFIKNYKE